MTVFFEVMTLFRKELLEKFMLPIGISYWKFIIAIAFASIIIVALVNTIPISLAGNAVDKRNRSDREARSDARSDARWVQRRSQLRSQRYKKD